MAPENTTPQPEDTAVRVALWRALHVQADAPPHVFEDEVGLTLVAPGEGWQDRPDMGPFTRPFRAAIVARARFIEMVIKRPGTAPIRHPRAAWTPSPAPTDLRHLAFKLISQVPSRPGEPHWLCRHFLTRGRLRQVGACGRRLRAQASGVVAFAGVACT